MPASQHAISLVEDVVDESSLWLLIKTLFYSFAVCVYSSLDSIVSILLPAAKALLGYFVI